MADEFTTYVYIVQERNGSSYTRIRQGIQECEKDIALGESLGYSLIRCFEVRHPALLFPFFDLCEKFTTGEISLSDLEAKVKKLQATNF